MTAPAARRLWECYEPIHDVIYFSPECRAAGDDLGLRGYWMGYFAFRAAPLGPVGPAPVTAALYGFDPSRAERALPDAWSYATPAQALSARRASAAAALRRSGVAGDVTEVADLCWAASQATDDPGRVLGAANRALPRPDDPVEALWQATTTLREHRGDGHVAVLVARGVGPLEAHAVKVAADESAPDLLRSSRHWPDEAWEQAVADLGARGWLDADGRLTAAGRAEHDEIEAATDRAAAAPWRALGQDRTARLVELLTPLTRAVEAAGDLPARSPVGLPVAGHRPGPG